MSNAIPFRQCRGDRLHPGTNTVRLRLDPGIDIDLDRIQLELDNV
jgi:hypothetical protein